MNKKIVALSASLLFSGLVFSSLSNALDSNSYYQIAIMTTTNDLQFSVPVGGGDVSTHNGAHSGDLHTFNSTLLEVNFNSQHYGVISVINTKNSADVCTIQVMKDKDNTPEAEGERVVHTTAAGNMQCSVLGLPGPDGVNIEVDIRNKV